jgi:hypothetical protein
MKVAIFEKAKALVRGPKNSSKRLVKGYLLTKKMKVAMKTKSNSLVINLVTLSHSASGLPR